jgi:hypothetical protein
VLTHCLLRALEELNYQGTYYALWWRAVQLLQETRIHGQHFQLSFNESSNPLVREAFAPVGAAESRVYARRIAMAKRESSENSPRGAAAIWRCTSSASSRDHDESEDEVPLSARQGVSCGLGCSTTGMSHAASEVPHRSSANCVAM